MDAEPILVVGASSKLGGPTVRMLREQDRAVRAMTRTPGALEPLQRIGVEVVQGDLRDPPSVARAVEGARSVIASAHAFTGKGANNPETVDAEGHRSLIDAAVTAEVGHFVYVSGLGVAADNPIDFFRIKYETERYLEASGLDFAIVRAGGFMETWVEIMGRPLAEKGRAVIFGRGDNPINFVSVEDVARFVVMALDREDLRGRTIEIGGPENLTLSQVVDILETAAGRKARRTHLPVPVLRLMSGLMKPFNPLAHRMMHAGAVLATEDATFDTTETLREFPMELTRFEDVARAHLGGKR